MNPICPYCKRVSETVSGEVIYPHMPELRNKTFYLCSKCMAYVGCHPGTGRPLGSLANAETRKARLRLHFIFDSIWKKGVMSRKNAYKMLADKLGIKKKVDCHIGLFDINTCIKAEEILTNLIIEETW